MKQLGRAGGKMSWLIWCGFHLRTHKLLPLFMTLGKYWNLKYCTLSNLTDGYDYFYEWLLVILSGQKINHWTEHLHVYLRPKQKHRPLKSPYPKHCRMVNCIRLISYFAILWKVNTPPLVYQGFAPISHGFNLSPTETHLPFKSLHLLHLPPLNVLLLFAVLISLIRFV